jgi:RHS repeat-associated protein
MNCLRANDNCGKTWICAAIGFFILMCMAVNNAASQPNPSLPNPNGYTAVAPGSAKRCDTIRAVVTPNCGGAMWDTIFWTGGLRLEKGWVENYSITGPASGWDLDTWHNGCLWFCSSCPRGPATLELTLVGSPDQTQAVWAQYGWDNYGTLSYQSTVAQVSILPGDSTTLNAFTNKAKLTANGSDSTSISAVLKDQNCAPLINQPVTFSTTKGTLSNGSQQGPSVTVNTGSKGYAGCTLIADTTAGMATVTASAMGHSASVKVEMWPVPPPPSPTDEESNVGGNKNVPYALEPVHAGLGNFVWDKTLFKFPGKGLPLPFKVSYNSWDGAYDGPLGHGWTHSHNVVLTPSGSTDVNVKWGDGHKDFYQADISGNFTPVNSNTTVVLTKPDSSHYEATLHSGIKYHFDASGRLTKIVDLNGNQITFTYSANLDRITDTTGRQINFTYSGNRITAITSPLKAGNTVSFQYNGNGDLTTITDPRGKVWQFTYDASHRVLTHVDARGNTVVTNTYDPVSGRITGQTDALGHTTTFAYTIDSSGTTTKITPPSGNFVSHTYDVGYNITKVIDGEGYQATFTPDQNGKMIATADKSGMSRQFAYDSSNNPFLASDRTGATSQLSFNTLNRPTAVTDPLNHTTSYGWDANGNLTSILNPNGDQMSVVSDSSGQPLSLTDYRGKTWTYTYGPLGLMQTATDPLGAQFTLAYDTAGRVSQITYPIPAIKTQATYDDDGNVLTRTDPLGNVTTFSYNDNGTLVSRTFVPTSATTLYAYDAANRLTKVINALGGETTYAYDVDGNIRTVTDPDGVTVTYEYDKANRVTAVADVLGHRTHFTYDANGKASSIQDELGNTWNHQYDPEGRRTGTRDPLWGWAARTYDKLGRLGSVSDQVGRTTKLGYDPVGNLTSIVLPDGSSLNSLYDPMGNRVTFTDALSRSWQAGYDDRNRMTSLTDPNNKTETYSYDSMGRITQKAKRNGQVIDYAYDLNGRPTTVTLPGPATITYGYDAAGNVTSSTDSTGITTMTYDKLGRQLTRTDPYGKTIAFSYTSGGRLSTMTYPGNKVVSYAYDTAGRLTTITDWLGNQTTYQYDSVNRVTRVTLPNTTRRDFTYDANGRVLTLTHSRSDSTVLASYAYGYNASGQVSTVQRTEPMTASLSSSQGAFINDPVNRLLSLTRDGVTTNYTFSLDGNLTAKTVGGVTTTFSYDALNRLISVSDGANTTTYGYDALGNRLTKAYNGSQTRYLRGGGAIYSTFDGSGSAQSYNIYAGTLLYSLDAVGNIRVYHGDERGSVFAITNAAQSIVQSYAYDPYGRVVGNLGSLNNEFQYVGMRGVLTDENGLYHMQARYYDPQARRFISEDPLGLSAGPNLYAYTDGDPINRIDPTGRFPIQIVRDPSTWSGYKVYWKKHGAFTDDFNQQSPKILKADTEGLTLVWVLQVMRGNMRLNGWFGATGYKGPLSPMQSLQNFIGLRVNYLSKDIAAGENTVSGISKDIAAGENIVSGISNEMPPGESQGIIEGVTSATRTFMTQGGRIVNVVAEEADVIARQGELFEVYLNEAGQYVNLVTGEVVPALQEEIPAVMQTVEEELPIIIPAAGLLLL